MPLCYASIGYVTPIVTQKRHGERCSNAANAVALAPSLPLPPIHTGLDNVAQAIGSFQKAPVEQNCDGG